MFVTAVNNLLADKDDIISAFDMVRDEIFDTAPLEAERETLHSEITVASELMQKAIEENARIAQDQGEYQKRYASLEERYETAKAGFEDVTARITDKQSRLRAMETFIAELAKQEGLLTEFNERLWHGLVDYATVAADGQVRFRFKDGSEI
jgi:chromosome segregation ATPase